MNTLAMRTNIKRRREEKGYSQSQMAELLHMDERNYKRIESGEKKTMDLDMLGRIADALETDWTELVAADTVNIQNNEIHDNQNGFASYASEATVNHFPPELKKAYEDMMQLMRDLLAEKDKMIAMQQKLLDKK